MANQRIYIDTSVIGGYFDDEFSSDTIKLFNRIQNGDFQVYISEISKLELLPAPKHVQELINHIPPKNLNVLEFTEEAKLLAEFYMSEKILGAASMDDAYHIAIATVNRVDVLLSWNFKHIVNWDKIRLFNSINLKNGYPTIEIRSPKELLKYED
ncbi:MAG: type II toxin-antitoxin system VapC family toxin [Bacteroidetes bacterium]|nr:type II toxin-antitoxin system VapC family toxin [Bacteroidota bacterium]